MILHCTNAQLGKFTQELCPGTDRHTDSHTCTSSSWCLHTSRIFKKSDCPTPGGGSGAFMGRTRVIKPQFPMHMWVPTHNRPGLRIKTTDHNHPHMAGAMGGETFPSLISSLFPHFSLSSFPIGWSHPPEQLCTPLRFFFQLRFQWSCSNVHLLSYQLFSAILL